MFFALLACASAAATTARAGGAADYDPLRVDANVRVELLDRVVRDDERHRDITARVYYTPSNTAPAPVVLFSHGLGGSRENNPYLGQHWARRGYVVVFMQHIGSDESVWRDAALAERRQALTDAADLQSFMDRVRDVPAVIDQLRRWNAAAGDALSGRMDLARLGMSGHSFGAITTQAVSGQQFMGGRRTFTDPRIKAAVVMSPSAPRRGSAADAFGSVSIPWLLMTGTKDVAPIGNATLESRYAVFPALPAGGRYELVLDGAQHSAFGERALPTDREPRNPNHHRAILALSTAFWDAWLRRDPAARAWLDGSAAPRSVLDPADRWQTE